jgi:hypothetical protein
MRLSGDGASIVVSSLKKINGFVPDSVYQPVFLSDAPGPTTGEQVLERLRLARALERVAHYRFHQVKHPDCRAPVRFDPIAEVLPKLKVENRQPLTGPGHQGSRA